eukprot:2139304-Rhodomonas_salina.1
MRGKGNGVRPGFLVGCQGAGCAGFFGGVPGSERRRESGVRPGGAGGVVGVCFGAGGAGGLGHGLGH